MEWLKWNINGINVLYNPTEDSSTISFNKLQNISLSGKLYTNYLYAKEERNFNLVLWDDKAISIVSSYNVNRAYNHFTYVSIVMKYYFSQGNIVDVYDYKFNFIKSVAFNNVDYIVGMTHNLNTSRVYIMGLVTGSNFIIYECDWDLNILGTNSLTLIDITLYDFLEGLGINTINNKFYTFDVRGRVYTIDLASNTITSVFTTDDFATNINNNLSPYKALKIDDYYAFFIDKFKKEIYQVDLDRAIIVNTFEISTLDNFKDLSFDSFNKYFYVLVDGYLYKFYWNQVNQFLYELENSLASKDILIITDDLGKSFGFYVKSYSIEHKRQEHNKPYYVISLKGKIV
jgi:hypothetical protein